MMIVHRPLSIVCALREVASGCVSAVSGLSHPARTGSGDDRPVQLATSSQRARDSVAAPKGHVAPVRPSTVRRRQWSGHRTLSATGGARDAASTVIPASYNPTGERATPTAVRCGTQFEQLNLRREPRVNLRIFTGPTPESSQHR